MIVNYQKIIENKWPKFCCIYHYGCRSGSFFLQTLLDNHPQVMTLPLNTPGEYNVLHEKCSEIIKEKSEDPAQLLIDYGDLKSAFDGTHNVELGLNTLGKDAKGILHVNQNIFKTHFNELAKLLDNPRPKDYILILHYAYSLALNQNPLERTIIVFHNHGPDATSMEYVQKDFQDLKSIITIRELRSATYSGMRQVELRKHYTEKHRNISYKSICIDNLNFSQLNISPLAKVKVIKLETLHMFPRESMSKLAKYLDIKFEDSLFESTCNGQTWWADLFTANVTGFAKHILNDKWKVFFNTVDSIVFEKLHEKYNEFYNYSRLHTKWPAVIDKFLFYFLVFIPTKYEYIALLKLIKKRFQNSWNPLMFFPYLLKSVKTIYNENNNYDFSSGFFRKTPIFIAKIVRLCGQFVRLSLGYQVLTLSKIYFTRVKEYIKFFPKRTTFTLIDQL